MRPLPEHRAETVFPDGKPALTRDQARVEANRCLYCSDAPCVKACPTEINIPEFIHRIATDNVKNSARTIFESNILGMSCARVCPVEVLCVGSCVYNHMGVPPIQIGKLQRFSTDQALDSGWQFFEAGPDSGRSVGLIGAGPASLACAHRLRRLGHRVTLYEKREVIGGLNVTGVAPYKMPADRAMDEISYLLSIGGIEIKTGVEIPRDHSWEELFERHDAIFVGMGLGPDSPMRIPGAELPGVEGAVDFIERMKLGPLDLSGIQHAVVVGGGNTAMDAVRELRGLGVPNVTLVYRGDEATMSGYAHEWAYARQLGVVPAWRSLPVRFDGEGQLRSVVCTRVDAQKQTIPDSEFSLPADLVLLAIGQSKIGYLLGDLPGITLDKGRVRTDAQGRTGHPRIFAGGDCANGGKEVVNAVAEGQQAAHAIHAFLGETR